MGGNGSVLGRRDVGDPLVAPAKQANIEPKSKSDATEEKENDMMAGMKRKE